MMCGLSSMLALFSPRLTFFTKIPRLLASEPVPNLRGDMGSEIKKRIRSGPLGRPGRSYRYLPIPSSRYRYSISPFVMITSAFRLVWKTAAISSSTKLMCGSSSSSVILAVVPSVQRPIGSNDANPSSLTRLAVDGFRQCDCAVGLADVELGPVIFTRKSF